MNTNTINAGPTCTPVIQDFDNDRREGVVGKDRMRNIKRLDEFHGGDIVLAHHKGNDCQPLRIEWGTTMRQGIPDWIRVGIMRRRGEGVNYTPKNDITRCMHAIYNQFSWDMVNGEMGDLDSLGKADSKLSRSLTYLPASPDAQIFLKGKVGVAAAGWLGLGWVSFGSDQFRLRLAVQP
ncbi:hypothetical protein BDN72DRAFT_862431 [Pluteus cervinus]|uniref:Uncharacterized protein n=1 Tax=Pluteus cervinus TaxID=181527 RepID=A0ACD3ABM3_9AGAR|nr:hypothetical protein BDN72DRAFT_862431 [Pluteus cervinus]